MNISGLRHALAPLIFILAFAAATATASASDICVGTSAPFCPTQTVNGDAAGLASAFVMAQDGSHPGHDRIIIASGTYSIGSGIQYSAGTGQTLTVIGQGDSTVLRPTTSGIVTLYIDFVGDPSDSISGIKFAPYAGVDSGIPYALSIQNGAASNLTFQGGQSTSGAYGLRIQGGSISNSTFSLPGDGVGALFAGDVHANNLTVSGDPTKTTEGIRALSGTTYSIARSTFRDLTYAMTTDQGTLDVSDSVIDLGSDPSRVGIWVHNNNGGAYAVGLHATNLTIVGTGASQYGIRSEVSGANTSVANIQNSILHLTGASSSELYCASAPANTSLTLAYSMINVASENLDPDCSGSISTGVINRTTVGEPFVDVAAGNYSLNAASPAIDAGDPAVQAQVGRTDFIGNARVVGFQNPCASRIDMGAYEAQSPGTCVPPSPPAPPAALSVKLGKAIGKFKIKKPAKSFTVGTKKPKSRVAITSSAKLKVKLTLKKGKKALKGSQSLTIPLGTSYLTFSGKFAGKTLPAGKYTLYVSASGLKDSPKSILNVIR